MATIDGTSSDDILIGGSEDDEIFALAGDDLLEGQAGDDTLDGGSGDDTLDGGNGDDLLEGQAGNDTLDGGNGDDILFGGPDGGGTGVTVTVDFESLEQNDAFLHQVGTIPDPTFTEDGALLEGFTATDDSAFFFSIGTESILFVDSTAVFLNSTLGTTTLTSVDGSTFTLESIDLAELGGVGPVTFTGEIFGGGTVTKTFKLDGDSGFETLKFGDDFTNLVSVSWDQGTLLTTHQFDNIVLTIGTGAVDDGNDVLVGGKGDDELNGGTGDDDLDGGTGDDLLVGGDDQDALVGGNGDDELFGGGGDDVLDGGKGDDILTGGAGSDILTGGGGEDTFVFGPGSRSDIDTITDFNLGNDILSLTDGLMIAGTSEADVDGDLVTDTVVTFDSGDMVTLLGVSGIVDPGDLLV